MVASGAAAESAEGFTAADLPEYESLVPGAAPPRALHPAFLNHPLFSRVFQCAIVSSRPGADDAFVNFKCSCQYHRR